MRYTWATIHASPPISSSSPTAAVGDIKVCTPRSIGLLQPRQRDPWRPSYGIVRDHHAVALLRLGRRRSPFINAVRLSFFFSRPKDGGRSRSPHFVRTAFVIRVSCARSWLSLDLHPILAFPIRMRFCMHRGADSNNSRATHAEPGSFSSGQLVKDL